MLEKQVRNPAAFSAYLDVLRGLSALVVAYSHIELFKIARPGAMPFLPTNAHDAVIVFFVLSGFLIAHAAMKPDKSLRSYMLDRAARIYSVALPLLIFVFAAALLGAITPEPARQVQKPAAYFGLFALFANQSWSWREIPFDLYPWWSLPFEVWYYIFFGCFLFLRGPVRIAACIAVYALMGPRLWMLLPTWLCGVAAFVYLNKKPRAGVALACALLPVLIYAGMKYAQVDKMIHYLSLVPWGYNGNDRPFGNASYFMADYIHAPLIALHVWGMAHVLRDFPAGLANAARRLANVSYTLYLSHALIYAIVYKSFGIHYASVPVALGIFALAIGGAFALAPLTEKRRSTWRRLFAKLWPATWDTRSLKDIYA